MEKKVGFNFLWMFAKYGDNAPEEPNAAELDFIANEGFNFVRIPCDYRFWTRDFDYTHPDERIIEYIDRYIEACNSRGLHACLNIHRAPGYCINWPEREIHNLWRDAEALDGFIYLWKCLQSVMPAFPRSCSASIWSTSRAISRLLIPARMMIMKE